MARQPAHYFGSACPLRSACIHRLPHVHLVKNYRHSKFKVYAIHDGGTQRQSTWSLPWPFKASADEYETEYEIVYVTDNGTENEQQQPKEEATLSIKEGQQQQQVAAGGVNEDLHYAQQQVDTAETAAKGMHEDAPEAAAAASYSDAAPSATTATTIPASSSVLAPAAAPSGISGFLESSAGGWIVAAALLLAVREGRSRADADRLDVRALQARQENSRVQSRELRERRAQYMQQQQALKEAQAAKSLAESARRAEAERQQAAARAAEYEKAALEELEALRARRTAAKKAFEESASRLDAELRERTARELALREEELARREQQQQQQRAAAEAEAARLAAEARRAAEAAAAAAREALEGRLAEKRQARQQSTRLQIQLLGQVAAAPVMAADGRSSSSGGKQLAVTIQLYPDSSSSSSKDAISSSSKNYESPDLALDGATGLAAAAAQAAVQHYTAAVAAAAGPSSPAAPEGLQLVQPTHQSPVNPPAAGGSSSGLGPADVELWRMLSFSRIESCARLAVCQVAPLAGSGELTQEFKVFHRYSALPAQHTAALQQQLAAAADMVGQDNVTGALEVLAHLLEWQLEDYIAAKPSDSFTISGSETAGANGSGSSSLRELVNEAYNATAVAAGGSAASVYLVPACMFAVMLDAHDPDTSEANKQQASSRSRPDSPDSQASSRSSTPMDTAADDEEMFDAVLDSSSNRGSPSSSTQRSISSSTDSPLQRLVKFQLEQITRDAPEDSLAPLTAALQAVLGRRHPVAAAMTLLAERNTSLATRQAREMRRQQQQLARATQLIQGSSSGVLGLGGLDPQGARLRQELVPVPERTWALRNVANNMLRTAAADSAAAAEALGMLGQAAELAAGHYGPNHPGQLPALLDYISALLAVPGRTQQAAAAIESACSIVAAVGERYRQQQDLLSLVLLYEATQAELDVPGVLGRDNVAMVRLQRQAADAFSVLETAQANLVMSKRKIAPGSPATALRQLARDCNEELGVYSSSRRRMTRLEQWNKGLPLAPLR